MTGLGWLLENDPSWREKQPMCEVPTNPSVLNDMLGSVGIRKEFGVHRQTLSDLCWADLGEEEAPSGQY